MTSALIVMSPSWPEARTVRGRGQSLFLPSPEISSTRRPATWPAVLQRGREFHRCAKCCGFRCGAALPDAQTCGDQCDVIGRAKADPVLNQSLIRPARPFENRQRHRRRGHIQQRGAHGRVLQRAGRRPQVATHTRVHRPSLKHPEPAPATGGKRPVPCPPKASGQGSERGTFHHQ